MKRLMRQQDNGKKTPAKNVALCGVFIALAMIMSYIKSLIPISFGIPGVKLGLANLCVLTCLYVLHPVYVFVILFLRVLLSSIMFGNMAAFIYSIAGGILSFFVLLLLKKTGKFSAVGVSVAGGVSHNIGQLIVAMLVVETYGVIWYLPVLLLSGTLTGLLIGAGSSAVLKYLRHSRKT